MTTAMEVAATEALRAANEFLLSDHTAPTTRSPMKRPQTAVGPRERLKEAAATFYRQHNAAADDAMTNAPPSTAKPSTAVIPLSGTIQAWITGEAHTESLGRIQQQLENDTKSLSATASDKLSLPFDFSQPDLRPLHDALQEKTSSYLGDLYQSFRDLRRCIATSSSLSPQLDAMFQSNHRFHSQADVLALLRQGSDHGRPPDQPALSKRQVTLMLTHCDTEGNGSVDMHVFLHLVQTVGASRETLLGHVFQAIAPAAALEKKSSTATTADRVLRVLKLVAMVRDVEAQKQSRADTAPVLAWLQSHTTPTTTRLAWTQFHRAQSDRFDSDADFVLYLDNVWAFLGRTNDATDGDAIATYESLLARRVDALAASKVLGRRGKLRDSLASTMDKVAKMNQVLAGKAKAVTAVALAGHKLRAASSSVLEKVAKALGHVTVVTISPLANTLPESFVCVGAVELDLSNVGLTALPAALGLMTQLRKLSASHNQLTTLPASAAQLRRLKHVNLSSNILSVVPAVAEHWKDVEEIDLAANNLVVLPDPLFKHWPNLTSLTVHDNRLAAIPDTLGTCCKALAVLLCHRNCLTSLPWTLPLLVKLTRATWHHNKLDDLFPPATNSTKTTTSLQRLQAVTTFTLAHNCLRHVPATVAFTSLKSLRVCDLSHNDLRDLRDLDFASLVQCVEVDLRRNRLTHCPPSLFRMPSLVHLSLQANVLVALPHDLASAPCLETLHAHTNHIKALPAELNRSLRVLDLSHNHITTIPLTWVGALGHRTNGALVLQTLHLEDNPLDDGLQQVVDNQTYTSQSHVALSAAIRKLVDYLQRTTTHRSKADFTSFQRASANDRKAYSLRVRKGRGKFAAEYVDWAFRDCRQHGETSVSASDFRRVLTALGATWTSPEWHRVLHEFQSAGQATAMHVEFERFLESVEGAQGAKASVSFPEGLLMCLRDKMPKQPPPQAPPPPPASTQTSLQSTAKVSNVQKKAASDCAAAKVTTTDGHDKLNTTAPRLEPTQQGNARGACSTSTPFSPHFKAQIKEAPDCATTKMTTQVKGADAAGKLNKTAQRTENVHDNALGPYPPEQPNTIAAKAKKSTKSDVPPHDHVRVSRGLVDRQRERLRVLERQLEDQLAQRQSRPQPPPRTKSAKSEAPESPPRAIETCCYRVHCMTSRRNFDVPWATHIKSARDLKRAICAAEGIPIANQILIVSSGSHRVRLHDDHPIDRPTPTSSRIQLLVGESVQPAKPQSLHSSHKVDNKVSSILYIRG